MACAELGDVFDGDVAVPDLLGIHDDGHAVLALVETARVIGADGLGQPARRQLGLEAIADIGAAPQLATPLRVAGSSLVDTDEYVTLKARHATEGSTLTY